MKTASQKKFLRFPANAVIATGMKLQPKHVPLLDEKKVKLSHTLTDRGT